MTTWGGVTGGDADPKYRSPDSVLSPVAEETTPAGKGRSGTKRAASAVGGGMQEGASPAKR